MTAEELRAIENLTNEIKEFRKVLEIFASEKYAEVRFMGSSVKPSSISLRERILDGLTIIDEIKKTL